MAGPDPRAPDPYAADAAFYDVIHGEGGDDLNFWLPFAAEQGGPILDVGAGTGRIALPLARAGHVVTALDPSPAMLDVARRRAAAEGLDLTFLGGGLPGAELPPAAFSAVIFANDILLACSTPGEQAAALRAAAGALAPHGRLAVDVAGPGHWLDPEGNGEPLLAFSGDLAGDVLAVWHTRHDDLASRTRHLRVRYELNGANGRQRCVESEHVLRYVTRDELGLMLESAGLRVLDTWGDFVLAPLTNASERLIVTAELAERSSQGR